jgi:hypothetical protein
MIGKPAVVLQRPIRERLKIQIRTAGDPFLRARAGTNHSWQVEGLAHGHHHVEAIE